MRWFSKQRKVGRVHFQRGGRKRSKRERLSRESQAFTAAADRWAELVLFLVLASSAVTCVAGIAVYILRELASCIQ